MWQKKKQRRLSKRKNLRVTMNYIASQGQRMEKKKKFAKTNRNENKLIINIRNENKRLELCRVH